MKGPQLILDDLTALYSDLLDSRQEYDFQPPALTSHAQNYVSDPVRLSRYATQTVNARIMLMIASSRMNTQALIQSYLLGVDRQFAFPLLFAARAQLELYAVVADAIRIVRECAAGESETFPQRVMRADVALINATYGTRNPMLKELMSNLPLSRLRPVSEEDISNLSSKNILTRLSKLAKSEQYSDCEKDYERLCEFVHPNWGMNMLHVTANPLNAKLLRLSLKASDPFQRALSASIMPMYKAASGTLAVFDGFMPPFDGLEEAGSH